MFNLAAAGIGVGILSVPLVASVSEDAMRAVPMQPPRGLVRARRAEDHDVPPGRVPGRDLGHRRGADPGDSAGPSARRWSSRVAAGAPQGRTVNPLEPGRHDDRRRWSQLATGCDQVTGNSAAFQSLFFIGLLLFIITLVLNVVGDAFVRRARQRY